MTLRPGQMLFNAIYEIAPEIAETIRGGDLDPFHYDDRFVACLREFFDAGRREGAQEMRKIAVGFCAEEEEAGVAERARLVKTPGRKLYDLSRQEGRYHAASTLRFRIGDVAEIPVRSP